MAVYCWKCAACEGLTDVERAIRDYEEPPSKCSHCDSQTFSVRVIQPPESGVKGFILCGDSGWHHTDYTRYRSIK